mgnify:FL=1
MVMLLLLLLLLVQVRSVDAGQLCPQGTSPAFIYSRSVAAASRRRNAKDTA